MLVVGVTGRACASGMVMYANTRRMKMRCLFGATIVICGLALLPGGCAQAAPPESREHPAAAGDDDRPPPPPGEAKPRQDAEKALTVTGVVASFHKNERGDVDSLRLEDGTEVRFSARDGEKVTRIISVKDRITIEGWTQRAESEMDAATIKNEASGKSVALERPAARGRPGDERPRRQGGRRRRSRR